MDTGDWHETKQFIKNRAISNNQNKYFSLWTYKNIPNIHHKKKNGKKLHSYKSNTKWTKEVNKYTSNTEKQTFYITK